MAQGQDKSPIELDFKSAQGANAAPVSLRTFSSYSFDRSILIPASPFRFTAPGVDKASRLQIRSGDMANLFAVNSSGTKFPVATGFIDETDTHITAQNLEYVLTGRDTLGQLVDNDSVDANNKTQNTKGVKIDSLLAQLMATTRIPQQYLTQQIPNGQLLFQTNPGETKINSLQRYLEFTNCLVWSMPDGRIKIGKPDFTQPLSGFLFMNSSDPSANNMVDCRVRRNLNQAIRQIVTQLQTMDQVDPTPFTIFNNDKDMQSVAGAKVGRSVYRRFSYGNGGDAVNTITQVGNSNGSPRTIGNELSNREIARENMKVLDIECVVEGHMNDSDEPYNIDQVYNVQVEDEDVNEDMLVYSVSYELTVEHGLMTRIRLCRLGTIVAYADVIRRSFK